jgi:hypothetical protein
MSEAKQYALALPVQPAVAIDTNRSAKQTRLAAFTPANLTEAIALAKMMAASEIVPKDYQKKPANIIVAIQFGAEIGLPPMQSLQSVSVINGRPALWGDGALALCSGHPDFEDIQESTEGTVATCIVKRRGRSPVIRKFSDDDAAKAGLLNKGPWIQYRNRMRQMRARGFALRDSFADVLKGISLAEEAMDIPTDTSQAKTQRESMTLDIANLQPSSEPNRGHEDTGLSRNASPKLDKDEQAQAPAKEAPTMCGECRKIGGHEKDCKHAEQDRLTSKPITAAVYLVKAAEKKNKKATKKGEPGEPYLVLSVVNQQNQDGKLYVWHKSMHDYFIAGAYPKTMLAEVSRQETKDGKEFFQVEHLLELAGVKFVDDKPAEEQAAMSADEAVEQELFGPEA